MDKLRGTGGKSYGPIWDVRLTVWKKEMEKQVKTQNHGDAMFPKCWHIFQKSFFPANTGGMQEAGE